MTIRNNNWCNDCQEVCTNHSSICTMCGGALTTTISTQSTPAQTNYSTVSFRAMPSLEDFLPPDLTTNDILRSVRQQVQATTSLATAATAAAPTATATGGIGNDEWQIIPEALLNPQTTASNIQRRPTSEQVLQKLPREILHEKSLCFFRVTLAYREEKPTTATTATTTTTANINTYDNGCLVTSEIGPLPSPDTRNSSSSSSLDITAPLWTPSSHPQRTCQDEDWTLSIPKSIVILKRGHNVSFYNKALKAQTEGAMAVIIVNDRREPWPYVMKDSRSKIQKDATPKISIPVVMMDQEPGEGLLSSIHHHHLLNNNNNNNKSSQYYTLQIHHNSCTNTNSNANANNNSSSTTTSSVMHVKTCVICRDELKLGQTSLTLTNYCGHVFHEECVLQWLQHHNTCPYCRHVLPTVNNDDNHTTTNNNTNNGESEEDRRRRTTGDNAPNAAFYS